MVVAVVRIVEIAFLNSIFFFSFLNIFVGLIRYSNAICSFLKVYYVRLPMDIIMYSRGFSPSALKKLTLRFHQKINRK